MRRIIIVPLKGGYHNYAFEGKHHYGGTEGKELKLCCQRCSEGTIMVLLKVGIIMELLRGRN